MKNLILTLLTLVGVGSVTLAQTSLLTKDCDLECLNKEYQVSVHMVMDSLGNTIERSEIESALSWTNQVFAPICVSFSVCEVDTIFDYSFDSIPNEDERMEFYVRQHDFNRINIYAFTDLWVGGAAACGLGALGQCNSRPNATIHYAKGCGGGTMAHEMGHVFGLYHPFESSNGMELVDGSNCATTGDLVCDTPADPYVENSNITYLGEECEFIYQGRDANGQFYTPQTGNTMAYYCGGCGFTKGQFLRMLEIYHTTNLKNW